MDIAVLSICSMALCTRAAFIWWKNCGGMADSHSHVAYTAAVLNGDESDDIAVGPIDQVVLKRFAEAKRLAGLRLWGSIALVQIAEKEALPSGMASRDIYADAFTPSAQTS